MARRKTQQSKDNRKKGSLLYRPEDEKLCGWNHLEQGFMGFDHNEY